jgi:hypothetical protein
MAVARPTGDGRAACLPLADRKGRMGVMYLRSLLAQAGLPNEETSPGEDHRAIDLRIGFRPAGAGVQVKCGQLKPNVDGSFSVPVKDTWRRKWAASTEPVYLVHVQLEVAKPMEWIDHPESATEIRAHAYWMRVNDCPTKTVRLPSENRLTLSTFDTWLSELEVLFGGAGGS